MGDPAEGVAPDGTIVTGVSRRHVRPPFDVVLSDAADAVTAIEPDASLYAYGSVVTGQAVVGRSDVDLLTIDLPAADAPDVARMLTARYADRCRGVDVAAMRRADVRGDHDEAVGNRAFVRHYGLHLCGPDRAAGYTPAAADAAVARGFNGDIDRHLARWRADLAAGADPIALARRVARKTLLAVAGLVSVHDRTWTTDRRRAAARWAVVDPAVADDLARLFRWTDPADPADAVDAVDAVERAAVEAALDGAVSRVVERFATDIGLWDTR